MAAELFDQTVSEIARRSGLTVETVRHYAKTGALESRTLSNGFRVFQSSAAAKAKALCAKNLAGRFRKGTNDP
jgi:DNA-binding transcriptional MerR regulator